MFTDNVITGHERLQILHKIDYKAHLEEVLERRCDHTGKWINTDPVFKNWKNSKEHETLWLTGDAGSGKTVMSASIINSLQKEFSKSDSQKPLVLYFFFDNKEQEKSDHLNVLPELLYQILCHIPGGGSIDTTDKFFGSTLRNCAKYIQATIKDLKVSKIFLVLDAIDECNGKKDQLLKEIFDLREHVRGAIKLLITSRPYPGPKLTPVFEKYSPPTLFLSQERVRTDIDRFLFQKLRDFTRIKQEELKDKVRKTVLKQAGGMFLWASLAWKMFTEWDEYDWSLSGVEKRLEKLANLACHRGGPKNKQDHATVTHENLYNFYKAILDTLPQPKRTRKLFKWLVTAHSPLTLGELRVAYALESHHDSNASLQNHLDVGDFRETVRALCGPFVKIVEATGTVQLVHQSMKEFFLKVDDDNEFRFDRAEAELDSVKACLQYLSLNDLSKASIDADTKAQDEEDFGLFTKYRLLRYASVYWPHHMRQVQEHPDSWNLFLSWVASGNIKLCFRLFWYFEGRGEFAAQVTPMHILCYVGLDRLVKRALEEGSQSLLEWATVDGCDEFGRTPLHWVTFKGQDKVAEIPLENGADPCKKDGDSFTPMDSAVDYGYINVFELLQTAAASTGRGGWSGGWLGLAASGGHIDILKRILEVSPPTEISDHGLALYNAALEGHTEIVNLLLEYNAPVDFEGKIGNPLQAAAFEEHLDIVQLLIKNGADPNASGGIYGSALQAASFKGSKEIVRELIKNDANVNVEGGMYGSPLAAAKARGHSDVTNILLKTGAIPSSHPALKRRPPELDGGLTESLTIIERQMKKGRNSEVDKKLEKFKSQILQALIDGNGTNTKLLMGVGLKGFRLAVKSGRERIIDTLFKLGMSIVVEAVKKDEY